MERGPIRTELLTLQNKHRTSHLPHGKAAIITFIDHARAHTRWRMTDDRIIACLQSVGFGACFRLKWVRLDWSLITALVERWRPETNTFHMKHGEMSISLQDVAIIIGLRIGLRIDGHPIF